MLPAELRDPVMQHALGGDSPLLRELRIDPGAARVVRVRYDALPSTPADVPRLLEVAR